MVLVSAAAIGAGCSSQTCGTRACIASFTATVTRDDGSFPSGMHRVEILSDLTTLMCTFTFPEGTLLAGGALPPQCPDGLTVTVGNEQTCVEVRTGDSVGLRCDPIPGQFVETITLFGTPGQVHAWQYADDVAILDTAAAPSYADTFPNGPECGGACRQASATWTLQ